MRRLYDGCCECGLVSVCGEAGENTKRYENHKLSDDRLPCIFHFGNSCFTPHWHENIEVLYFHEDCNLICDRREYNLKKHEIAVINSNALHAIPPKAGGGRHDCLIVDAAFLEKNGVKLSSLLFDCQIRDEEIERLFLSVAEEVSALSREDAFTEAAVKAAILSLSVRLCRSYARFCEGERGRGDAVKRAIGYIKAHFDEPLTVDDIASRVNVSKYYFCREFHSETGYTVVRYINNLRCLEAQKLLREGKYSVGEVAHRCGFENLSYFTRTYKTIIGCTPTSSKGCAD